MAEPHARRMQDQLVWLQRNEETGRLRGAWLARAVVLFVAESDAGN
jgi:hypothetical protein